MTKSQGLAGFLPGEGEPASATDVNGENRHLAPEGSPALILLRRSCEASGVPLRLEDEATAAQIAQILRSR